MLPADKTMLALIDKFRAPFLHKLNQKLGVSSELLYRQGNFNAPFDQLILDAMLEATRADIALFPGFRWGTSILPNRPINLEQLMSQTAISYPNISVTQMSGSEINEILERACHRIFSDNPYQITGEDMFRTAGMQYHCNPRADFGNRITNMMRNGKQLAAHENYKVAHWGIESTPGQAIWDAVANYLRNNKTITSRKLSLPKMVGIDNPAELIST